MIDLTNPDTIVTLKEVLGRALNSYDNEITAVAADASLNNLQRYRKLDILYAGRNNTVRIYDDLREIRT